MGRIDQYGWLTLADRKKDMILFAGENVYSAEVERVIYEHPAVEMAGLQYVSFRSRLLQQRSP